MSAPFFPLIPIGSPTSSPSFQTIVAAVYNADAPDAKHQLARLINALASTRQGRAYLLANAKGADLLGQLVLALRAKRVKDHSSDHTLAALQKLSLRLIIT